MSAKRAILGAAMVALAACAAPDEKGPRGQVEDPRGPRYEVTTTVLGAPGRAPKLCGPFIQDSLPPQCGEVPIPNWDWDSVEGEETFNGVVWGSYRLVGTFDGDAFTLTEPARTPERQLDTRERSRPPCPEPPGGWRPFDPDRTTDEAMMEAGRYANAQPDFAGIWLSDFNEYESESDIQHLDKIVYNVAFTGDLERHERELRERWGGALCVVRHERTLTELRRIQSELTERVAGELGLRWHSIGPEEVENVVRLSAFLLTEDDQRALDERYGPGVVRGESFLQPLN